MANIAIQKIDSEKPVFAPVLKELTQTFDAIRKRAFELFEHRGGTPGNELDDWIEAEKDLFWVPQAELAETDTEFRIQVAAPGFDAKDIRVTAQPGEILVRADSTKRLQKRDKHVSYSEFGEKSLYRRFELATPINVDRAAAHLEHGMVTITAPKKIAAITRKAAA